MRLRACVAARSKKTRVDSNEKQSSFSSYSKVFLYLEKKEQVLLLYLENKEQDALSTAMGFP
jgi:hypothetical protein